MFSDILQLGLGHVNAGRRIGLTDPAPSGFMSFVTRWEHGYIGASCMRSWICKGRTHIVHEILLVYCDDHKTLNSRAPPIELK